MANVLQFTPRKPLVRNYVPREGAVTYCPIPFFIENEITYLEFQRALKAAGMQIITDPQHPGDHVVVRVSAQ